MRERLGRVNDLGHDISLTNKFFESIFNTFFMSRWLINVLPWRPWSWATWIIATWHVCFAGLFLWTSEALSQLTRPAATSPSSHQFLNPFIGWWQLTHVEKAAGDYIESPTIDLSTTNVFVSVSSIMHNYQRGSCVHCCSGKSNFFSAISTASVDMCPIPLLNILLLHGEDEVTQLARTDTQGWTLAIWRVNEKSAEQWPLKMGPSHDDWKVNLNFCKPWKVRSDSCEPQVRGNSATLYLMPRGSCACSHEEAPSSSIQSSFIDGVLWGLGSMPLTHEKLHLKWVDSPVRQKPRGREAENLFLSFWRSTSILAWWDLRKRKRERESFYVEDSGYIWGRDLPLICTMPVRQ